MKTRVHNMTFQHTTDRCNGLSSPRQFLARNRLWMCCQIILCTLALLSFVSVASAQTSVTVETNPNSDKFRLVVCDGPSLPSTVVKPAGYVACDFNGVMMQIQHLINIMMILGVFVAIAMFIYAGVLYMSGRQGNLDKAHKIFPKVFFGFIIMLSAWFIVYQILSWLTDNQAFKTLLGAP